MKCKGGKSSNDYKILVIFLLIITLSYGCISRRYEVKSIFTVKVVKIVDFVHNTMYFLYKSEINGINLVTMCYNDSDYFNVVTEILFTTVILSCFYIDKLKIFTLLITSLLYIHI